MVMAGSSINSPVIGQVKNSISRAVCCRGVPDEEREEEEEGGAGILVVVLLLSFLGEDVGLQGRWLGRGRGATASPVRRAGWLAVGMKKGGRESKLNTECMRAGYRRRQQT